MRSFAAQTMRFPTGEKWSYCNAGYVILGVVIHRVTGKFWFDFVKERIFDPLGMTATRLISPDDIIMNRVSGYQMLYGEWKNEPWVSPEWKTADGMLYTNVFDMAKWDAALYTDKLIKRSSLEQMWTPVKLNNGTTYPYGFAWRIREVNGHRLIQHDGVGPAFTTRFARYVNDRLSIIVFMNSGEDDEAAMPTRITDAIAAIYIPDLGDFSVNPASSYKNSDPETTMRKAYFFSASPVSPLRPRFAQAPMNTAPAGDKVSASAQPLSAAQKEVWAAEESMHRYEQQRDAKRFLSLWDDNFVGWPDYEPRPVRKPEIEEGTVEEFQTPQTPGRPLPAPQPEAIAIFGDSRRHLLFLAGSRPNLAHRFSNHAHLEKRATRVANHRWHGLRSAARCAGADANESASSTAQAEEEKAAAETVRRYEQAVQEYDFAKADSFVAPNAKWIERSLPQPAAYDGTGFFAEAKAARVRLTNEPHDFQTQIQGSVAWVTLLVDVTTIADNVGAGSLLARTETEETGKISDPSQGTWRASYVESEVLVRTSDGWKIAMAHTSRLPAK